MKSPFLSVVVPVYNAEEYLESCLDSVLAQTFDDIEIICIDDGSSDASSIILDEYDQKNQSIRVIHKTNGGIVSVRKLGAIEARGKYIGFVDSDDWIDSIMYEKLCEAAELNDADIVSSSYWQEGAYSNVSSDAVEAGVYIEEGMSYLREHAIFYMEKCDKGLSGSLCTKIFKTDMFKKIMPNIPDKVRVSEDKITTLTFLLDCKKAVILDGAFYHYRVNQNSMFHAEDPGYLFNYHLVYTYFKSLYSHKNFTENMRVQAELYIVQFLIKGINTQMGFSFRNLMWIDPIWIEDSSLGTRIALCGKGDIGNVYEKHIRNNKSKKFVGYINVNFNDSLLQYEFDSDEEEIDSIVITTKNEENANKIKKILLKNEIPKEIIYWFKQEEIFWKYAEAMGILKGN